MIPLLPARDRRFLLGAAAGIGLIGVVGLAPPLVVWPVVALLLANVAWGGVTLFPYDRVLSASSADGLVWERERGVRIDVAQRGGDHSGGVYFPAVHSLADGSWRMYFRGSDIDRVLSASSHDGLTWIPDPGIRIDAGRGRPFARASCPRVLPSPDGHRMLFAAQPHGESGFSIYSASSLDGMCWSQEEGVRLAPEKSDEYQSIFSFCVVEAGGGLLRLYYEGLSKTRSCIYSAISRDGQKWQKTGLVVEPSPGEFGVRFPWVVGLPGGGEWRMYFASGTRHRSLGASICSARSSDGVTWEREEGVRVRYGGRYGSDGVLSPCVVRRTDGRLRMYYGAYWGWHLLAPLTRRRHRTP